jgi:membrane carboxypeptidase/penicillin-binding protein PbpC
MITITNKNLSPAAQAALAALVANPDGFTLAELKDALPDVNSAHLTALVNRGLVSAEKVEKEVTRVVKTKVNRYKAVK